MTMLRKLITPCLVLCSLAAGAEDKKVTSPLSCDENFSEIAANLNFDLILELDPITPGFAILEGPLWLDGSLIMSHIGFNVGGVSPSDRIALRDGKVTVLQKDYLSNGLTLNHLGNVVAARHLDGTITGVENARIFASEFDGKRFNSPNDLIFSSNGNLYFTDPSFQAPTEGDLQDAQRSYHVTPFGEITAFGEGIIENPNGVMLSLDEKTLYIGGSNGVFKFAIEENGKVVDNPQKILEDDIANGVDGMSRDSCGNLFIAAAGKINIVSVDEEFLGATEIPGITNIAFGGDSGKDIFTTTLGGRPAVFRAQNQWPVPGLPF